jgi:hypothetical protein
MHLIFRAAFRTVGERRRKKTCSVARNCCFDIAKSSMFHQFAGGRTRRGEGVINLHGLQALAHRHDNRPAFGTGTKSARWHFSNVRRKGAQPCATNCCFSLHNRACKLHKSQADESTWSETMTRPRCSKSPGASG